MTNHSTGSRSAEKVTPASEVAAPEMGDIFDKLAADIKRTVKEGCAKVAEIHIRENIPREIAGRFYEGYNAACRDIAAKIREL